MAAFNKFNSFVEALAEKVHKLDTDVLKIMLTNTAPVAGNAVKTDITEITAANGYTAGGIQATMVTSAQSGGVYKLVLNDVTWTATGGSINTFRYAVLYNDSATNKELIGWWDYGTAITVTVGNAFTVDLDATNGVVQIT